jgi:putative FmdB family regulatory protein
MESMPLYEYRCEDCGKNFERIVLGQTKVVCPECEGRKVTKLLSVFAVSTSNGGSTSPSESPASCGSCGDPRGPGSCALD